MRSVLSSTQDSGRWGCRHSATLPLYNYFLSQFPQFAMSPHLSCTLHFWVTDDGIMMTTIMTICHVGSYVLLDPGILCPPLTCSVLPSAALLSAPPPPTILFYPTLSYSIRLCCNMSDFYFLSDDFALKVGDPDAPKRAFRHTGLDTYAVRSLLTPTWSGCAAGCTSTRVFFDDDDEEVEIGGGEEDEEAGVVVEPRIGCISSPKRSMVSWMKSVGESSSGRLVPHCSLNTSFSWLRRSELRITKGLMSSWGQ